MSLPNSGEYPAPPGDYELREVRVSPATHVLGPDTRIEYWYTRSESIDERRAPLIVAIGPEAARLFATEGHPGRAVPTPAGREALYHDGMWTPGGGMDERRLGQGILVHWDTNHAHSVVVSDSIGGRSCAVRSAKESLSMESLVELAESALLIAS